MRTIFAEFRDSLDRPVNGVRVEFRRIGLAVKGGAMYLQDSHTAESGADGKFFIDLLETTDSELATLWRCTIPGEAPFHFSLESGTPVNLADLRTIGVDPETAETLRDLIEALDEKLSDHIGRTSAHGVEGQIVGTTDSQTLDNKTINCGTY